jgi:hypothetical protein
MVADIWEIFRQHLWLLSNRSVAYRDRAHSEQRHPTVPLDQPTIG